MGLEEGLRFKKRKQVSKTPKPVVQKIETKVISTEGQIEVSGIPINCELEVQEPEVQELKIPIIKLKDI